MLVGESVTLNVTNTPDFTMSVSPTSGAGCVKSGNNAVICTPTEARTYTVTVTSTNTARSASATLTVTAPTVTEIKIPITIALSYPIYGADFKFTHTNGLEFNPLNPFEVAAATQSASPIGSKRDDGTNFAGFFSRNFNAGNEYVPQNGALNVGNLILSWSGASGQSITMTEATRFVVPVDGVDEELTIPVNRTIPISSSGNQSFRIAFP